MWAYKKLIKIYKLYTDIMHMENDMFLILVIDPLNLTLQLKERKKKSSRMYLGRVLQGQLAVLTL